MDTEITKDRLRKAEKKLVLITARLREVLNRSDIDSDGMVNRKVSSLHNSNIDVLLDHVTLLVADLRFDAEASRREMFEVRKVLEE